MSKPLSKRTQKKLDRILANTGDMALKRRANMLVACLNPQKKERILDVGCGDGFYLHVLTELNTGASFTGTDIDEIALKNARKVLRGKRITLVPADLLTKTPFKTNTFNKINMSEVAEHLPDDVKGLSEVRRILKKDGTLALSVPNKRYPFLWDPVNWILERVTGNHIDSGFWAGIWNQHERLYTVEDITEVLTKAGFRDIHAQAATYWSLPFNHYIVNAVARMIAGKQQDGGVSEHLSKYNNDAQKPWYLAGAFWLVNTLDRLNNVWAPQKKGVAVVVCAKK